MISTKNLASLNTTLHKVLEDAALEFPDKVAVKDASGKSLTYAEFLLRAKSVGYALRTEGAVRNKPVGILMDRSADMIVAIFGILFSGAPYLPLDPAAPASRNSKILSLAEATLLVTSKLTDVDMPQGAYGHLILENIIADTHAENVDLEYINDADDLAYVIFTSGSTGDPKGVMIEHRSVVNRLQWMKEEYELYHEDVLIQKTPYIFDVSVWELFLWCFAGSSLYVLEPGYEKFPQTIVSAVEEHKVSYIHFIPSLLNVFLNYVGPTELKGLASLKYVFCSGESLGVALAEKFYGQFNYEHIRLVNFYGPTEATVDVTYYNVLPQDLGQTIPIGHAIANTEIHIIDGDNVLQEGEVGELAISGVNLARGYINQPGLTDQYFVYHEQLGKRIYKSGDQASMNSDGLIHFYGRNDDQVKVRGIRIELGEIENILLRHASVEECVVILDKKSDNVMFIVAYIINSDNANLEDIKEYVKSSLPMYMIPNRYVEVTDLPRLASGKIDRKQLRSGVLTS
ncbi:amino acid adenylation domain-containing protein [Fulvivirga sediminis]|uniref:Amino acid adenylation domain-containing protein n=1 Tax=Fulvivirga sediminis TaxID=2803949 RepID=A0A937FD65_9BACT|nr:amino acid adenylation domain-containing protein [Fulvivirga sediminis]MBL3658740.1 amino acid adenylation domain-containing protein [Fulvivirga sediminis]